VTLLSCSEQVNWNKVELGVNEMTDKRKQYSPVEKTKMALKTIKTTLTLAQLSSTFSDEQLTLLNLVDEIYIKYSFLAQGK